jgi:hypothetical protein
VRLQSVLDALWTFWRRGRNVERAGYVIGAALLSSGLIHFAILAIGGGSWEGPVSLRKAMTFGISFGITAITVAWVSSFLRLGDRARTALLGTFTAACVFETVLVSLQAWRGVPSHFNVATPFDALVTRGLAIGGFTLILIIVTLTFASFRATASVPVSVRLATRIGFVLLDASLLVGALMIARGMSLVFAGSPQAAYASGGWLKPTHAVTMHAILVLPALAWLSSFTAWTERRRVQLVLLASAGYVTLVGAVAVANLRGLPPSGTSYGIIALLVIGGLAVVSAGVITASAVRRTFSSAKMLRQNAGSKDPAYK